MVGFQRLGLGEARPGPCDAVLPGLAALANRLPTQGTLGRNADTLQVLSLGVPGPAGTRINAGVM